MKVFPDLMICECCDSVYRRPMPMDGGVAHCERCAFELCRGGRLRADGWLALTIAAGVMFLMANSYPVLQINLQGIRNETTLWQSAGALAQGLAVPIAVPAALFIILVPFLQIFLLGWVLSYSRVGRRAPGFVYVMHILSILRPWSMVEVGLLGILIAAIKLSKLADIVLGAGIWAMAASMILMTIVSKRDLSSLWDMGEYSRQRTPARA